MKLSRLIRHAILPLVIVALLLTVTTVLAPRFSNQSGYMDDLFEVLDLREEGNVATWFTSMVFLLCGLSFLPLKEVPGQLSDGRRTHGWLFVLFAAGCVLLSADEAGVIHERVGVLFERTTGVTRGTPIEGLGFSWVLLFAPVAVAGGVLVLFALGRLISNMPGDARGKRLTRLLLGGVVLCVPAALLFEWLQSRAHGQFDLVMMLTAFEESLELVPALCLMGCNAMLSEAYEV